MEGDVAAVPMEVDVAASVEEENGGVAGFEECCTGTTTTM